ncbi:MAG: hypothetical protein PWQ82_1802, partial [Thermosediminibacterales bacterium]|nr:hypothetical protein [Thermosediminibacterales bacterium]
MSNRQTDFVIEWHSKDLGHGLRVALGDVNGDGRLELLAGTTFPGTGPTHVYVFRWDGGYYRRYRTISLSRTQDVNSIFTGDLDGDGIDEIVVGGNGGIFVYKLTRTGYLRVFVDDRIKGRVTALAVADIDRDGRKEIIAAASGSNRLYIIKSTPQGYSTRIHTVEGEVLQVDFGDVDGDRSNEVVVLAAAPDGSRIYLLQWSGGSLVQKKVKAVPKSPGRVLVVGDADNDGIDEILFDLPGGRVYLLDYTVTGFINQWISPYLDASSYAAAIADIDKDAGNEIIITTLESTYIFSKTDGRFILESKQDIPNGIISIAIGDIDGNRANEIVLGTRFGYVYIMEAKEMERGKIFIGKVQTLIRDQADIPEGKPDIAKVVDAKAKIALVDTIVRRDKVIV